MFEFGAYHLPVWAGESEGGSGGAAAEAGAASDTGTDSNTDTSTDAQTDAQSKDTASEAGQDTDADKAAASETSDDKAAADKDAGSAAEFNLSVPEGADDYKGDIEAFHSDMATWLKENPNATPAQALQEAVNRQSRVVAESMKAQQEAAEANFTKQVETWEAEAKADSEIGGTNFDANVAVAIKALDTFGTPGLRDALRDTGLGSHPEVIRFAMKAGQALKDAKIETGATQTEDSDPLADRYPTNAK